MTDLMIKTRRGAALLTAVIFALVIFAEAAVAIPQYAKTTGKPCSYCHKNPQGGKELTDAGKYYSKHKSLKGFVEPTSTTMAKPVKPGVMSTAKPKMTTKPKVKHAVKASKAKGHRVYCAPRGAKGRAMKHYRTHVKRHAMVPSAGARGRCICGKTGTKAHVAKHVRTMKHRAKHAVTPKAGARGKAYCAPMRVTKHHVKKHAVSTKYGAKGRKHRMVKHRIMMHRKTMMKHKAVIMKKTEKPMGTTPKAGAKGPGGTTTPTQPGY